MRLFQRDRLNSLRRAIRERQKSHDGPDDADTVALDVVELIDILLAEWDSGCVPMPQPDGHP
jgi:hypothetical protein